MPPQGMPPMPPGMGMMPGGTQGQPPMGGMSPQGMGAGMPSGIPPQILMHLLAMHQQAVKPPSNLEMLMHYLRGHHTANMQKSKSVLDMLDQMEGKTKGGK